jgi:uncharacterized DUF497 family protein
MMTITFDPAKREEALRLRGLDFRRASEVFDGAYTSAPDNRFDYGETRIISAGFLGGRMVVIVWTPRGEDRHIISMRYCHAKEEKRWRRRMD